MSFLDPVRYMKDCSQPNEYRLTPYLVNDNTPHPFAIICPGGAYHMICDFREGEPFAHFLNSKGISAFVLSYHVNKKAHFPAPIDDLAMAVKEILSRADELNLETENYSIWGSSAGGHLACCFSLPEIGYARYHLPKPKALVLIYPVITMGKNTHRVSKGHFLGHKPSIEDIDKYSIEKHITDDFPMTFVWCGDCDHSVKPVNSGMLVKQLEKHAIKHEFHLYPNVGHGVGLGKGTSADNWIDDAVRFWLSNI